jgi:hypothetical protein
MEATCSSETLANLYQTIWCHIPEDSLFKVLTSYYIYDTAAEANYFKTVSVQR